LDGISPEVFFLRQGDKDDLKNRASRVTMSFKQLERLYNRDEYRIVLPGEGFFSVCKELFGRKIIQSFEEIMPFGGNSQLELEYAMAFKCMIS
jgi:hypothetical protein